MNFNASSNLLVNGTPFVYFESLFFNTSIERKISISLFFIYLKKKILVLFQNVINKSMNEKGEKRMEEFIHSLETTCQII